MKENIIHLIQDDIKISKLISNLQNLGISACNYYLNNSRVIFNLMGIPIEEETQDLYHRMIELGSDAGEYNSSSKNVEELAEDIYSFLKIMEMKLK